MKIRLAIFMIMLLLTGCGGTANAQPMEESHAEAAQEEGSEKISQSETVGEEGEKMGQDEKERVKIIAEAAGCPEKKAASIWRMLQEAQVPIGEVVEAEKATQETDYSIVVTNKEGKKYQIGIDKTYFVYSVKDLDTGEYVYAVYE